MQDRTQSVTVGDAQSDPQILCFVVLQGSVLGPKLFSVHVQPLGKIFMRHSLEWHLYADDTQVYFSFNPDEVAMDDIIQKEQDTSRTLKSGWAKTF